MGVNERLEEIKTAIEGLSTALGTTQTTLGAMQTTLESIANALGTPPEAAEYTIDDIYGLLNTISGHTAGLASPLSNISSKSNLISDYTNDTRTRLWYAFRNLGLNVETDTLSYTNDSYLFETLNWLGLLSGATGLPIQSGNRTIIQLLALLLDRPTLGEVTGGLFPNDLCVGYYSSTGMIIVPTGVTQVLESTIWADFPIPPPVGIEFGSTFDLGLDSDTTELVVLEDNWDNWRFYVASSASNYGIYIGTDINMSLRRYPANVWQRFTGLTTNLSFFVPSSESIKVFMCQGDGSGSSSGGPWGGGTSSGGGWGWSNTQECIEIASSLIHIDSRAETRETSYAILPPNGIVGQNSIDFDDPWPAYSLQEYAIWLEDLYGFTVSLVTGSYAGIGYNKPSGGSGGGSITVGSPYTFTEHTSQVIIVSYWGTSDPAPSEFTIEVCRP